MFSALFSYFLHKNSNAALKISRFIIAVKYPPDDENTKASNSNKKKNKIYEKYETKIKTGDCCYNKRTSDFLQLKNNKLMQSKLKKNMDSIFLSQCKFLHLDNWLFSGKHLLS